MDKQIVIFDLGNRTFGVDVASVVRVGQIPEITKKPNSPSFIEGQMNCFGYKMPILDLHRWFGVLAQERTEDSCILFANLNGMRIGMIVSAVTDVLEIDENKIKLPTSKTDNDSDYIVGFSEINGQLITLVDLDLMLTKEEKDQLELFQIISP